MLNRLTRADRRQAATARQRRNKRYSDRQRSGRVVINVEIDEAIIGLLIRTDYLAERDAANRNALTKAVARLLKDAAENKS